MRRAIFPLATGLSAIIFITLVLLWVRNHFLRDYAFVWLPYPSDSAGQRYLKLDFDSGGGQVEIAWKVWPAALRDQVSRRNSIAAANVYHRTFDDIPSKYSRSSPPTFWNSVGFKAYSGPTHSSVYLPYWFAVLVSGMAPAGFIGVRVRRRLRAKPGHCANCGYDLRATPDRCPECGMQTRGL
jgi:hypothetical protein